jgi:L-ascorbate metabolism protein UlaG (beta-lactamase superfamily)
MTDVRLTHIGGPTMLIEVGGWRLLTDPTFDAPGRRYAFGWGTSSRKLAGPAIPAADVAPIDAVLLSHEHHADNLDPAGRALLPETGRVLTTVAGAERLGGNATGLEPGEAVELERPGSGSVRITAVPAEHGPPEVAAKNGPVIGFVLRGARLPTVYVSGDNASVDVVRTIEAEHGPVDVAVLFVGGAQVPAAWGDAYLTLTADAAVEAAKAMNGAPIVPVHQDGWAHFTSSAEDVRRAFNSAGLADRLRPVAPGEQIALT